MKRIILTLIVGFFLISSPLVGAYKPDEIETTGTMSVTVKADEEVNWLDRIGHSIGNLFAVSIQEEQYEPGDTAEGEIWGYQGAVASDEDEANSLLGPKCDFDTRVIVCVYIQHQDKSVPSAVDCADMSVECGDLSRSSWSAEIYDGADEGTYDVYAKYMFKYVRSWREKYDYGSAGTIEVKKITEQSYKQCSNGDVYWYDSEDNRGELYERCDYDEECTNGRCISQCEPREYKQCSNGDVYWYNSCDERGDLYERCGSNERCSNSKCVSVCEDRAYRECSNGDVYWYDSCDNKGDRYEDCGSDSCEPWEERFCSDNKVKTARSCTKKGCSGGSCYSRYEKESKVVETCRYECLNGQCVQDSDGDGIIDKNDKCLNTPGQDPQGCPYNDQDRDGVYDRNDKAPNTYGSTPDGTPTIIDSIVNFFVNIGLWSR